MERERLEAPVGRLRRVLDGSSAARAAPETPTEAFALAALERHKREGMDLAFRVRLGVMGVIAVMTVFIAPREEVLFYLGVVALFVLIGWAQRRVARVGRSRAELALIVCDVVLLTVAFLVPGPFSTADWPEAMRYRLDGFKYFFLFLALGCLAYTWRTVWAIGVIVALAWGLGLLAVVLLGSERPELAAAAQAAFGHDPAMLDYLDPTDPMAFLRAEEVVVVLLVAATLAFTMRRYGRLVLGQAAAERERANLARYFSPNVVAALSRNDDPLKEIRTQDVAVLFVDIVGFTAFAAERKPVEAIYALRDFHRRMEAEVFRHGGTLDKYLGDGLMATFGTPAAGEADATRALRCARAMVAVMAAWSREREAAGEPAIRAGFGLHFGPAVLGDIGANRLEFAVIGDTVNVASRVEALTRELGVELAATEALCAQVQAESGAEEPALAGLAPGAEATIRGGERRVALRTLARA
ncbi:MAG: adenylate/guanylate cyclase domain-containing protein [Pikeienuella sp.]|uniref:adenylate/guanylate cyclase domain-containing protein n=1 Tax=Pikeienuella sp. TaxID=2831957 RepID=UPI00391C5412